MNSKLSRSMSRAGVIGLIITLATNLLGTFVIHRPSSAFFSALWLQSWIPAYAIWMAFATLGLACRALKL